MDAGTLAAVLAQRPALLRFRQGEVTAIAADGTVTVKIAGSSTAVSGIKCLASVCPKVGGGIWLASDGVDVFAIGTMTPTGPAYAAVRRSTTQTISDVTDTAINFLAGATVEADTHGMFSTASPDKLTVQVPGVYLFTYGVSFAANGTGLRNVWIEIDGTTYGRDGRAPSGAGNNIFAVSAEVACAAGAVVKLWVRQSSGGSLDCPAVSYAPRLTASWLRPPTT